MSEPPESNEQSAPAEQPVTAGHDDAAQTWSPPPEQHEQPQGMLPVRERRRSVVERGFVRIIATGGIVGITTILGAVLVSQDVAGGVGGVAGGVAARGLAAPLWAARQPS